MVHIPFIELQSRSVECRADLESAIGSVLRSGTFVGGAVVDAFEREWADYCGTNYAVGVGNGLDALRMALQAHGIGPGDEVLVPAQTFIATWLAVEQAGAVPISVDIEATSGNMSLEAAAAAVTPRTAAIVLVHLHGAMADVRGFRALADKESLLLLEDAAQAHGASVDGVKSGAWGDSAAFSFYPTKNLGAIGDAGAITTNDAAVASRVKRLRSYGADPKNKYSHEIAGWNSRLDPVQAAALSAFLPKLDSWNSERRLIASRYIEAVASCGSLEVLNDSVPEESNVWHHFVVRSEGRERLREQLLNRGIGTEIHYPELPRSFASSMPKKAMAPNALRHASQVLSLPMHPWLSETEVSGIAEAVAAPMPSL